eukprot:353725-Chlamydomonas_euryale.AAC.7
MDPQGRQDKLSTSHCTAGYLRYDHQLAMEQPSTQLAKAGLGVSHVAGKRFKALRQTTLPVPCSQPALPIVGAKWSSYSMDKKPKQACKWLCILCQHTRFLHVSQAAKSAFKADKMKKAEQDNMRTCAPSRMASTCWGFMQLEECMRSCHNINAADWKAALDAMGRDAMYAGDEAVDLASDEDMAGAAEAEAMATEKAL